ncbi:MAG: GNAT family N-acetyltransferase, partial [Coriobacteriia bacterium]|nr:GNAT family N-acetyltransferase [Coriobacteriia bacterium]
SRFSLAFIDLGTPEYAEAAELRYGALYVDLGLPRALIADTDGRTYRHLAAFDSDGRIVGYARIWLEDGHCQIFQVSVADAWRGNKVGAALVRELVELAASLGRLEVTLDARAHVIGFYERLGFQAYGEEFLSARTGTPHRAMRLALSVTES